MWPRPPAPYDVRHAVEGTRMASFSKLGRPAERLQGRRLEGGWTVVDLLDRPAGSTGGNFSVGYKVRHDDGTWAFMKAHDYARAISHNVSEFSKVLEDMLAAYNFEKELNEECRGARM